MECQKCGFDNPKNTRFCGQCGSNLTGEDLQEGDASELPILQPRGKGEGRRGQIIKYTVEDGLTPGIVFTIYKDTDGSLWFGTSAGACRFDGFQFRIFTEEEGLELGHHWSGSDVYAVMRDSRGYLWFGTSAGASRFDGKEFRNFTTEDGLVYNGVNAIYEDSKGYIWFGTGQYLAESGNGVSRYDGSSFENFTYDQLGFPAEVQVPPGDQLYGASIQTIFDIMEDGWGDIWFATRQGLSRYDGKSFQAYTSCEVLHANLVRSICKDDSGHLWFADGAGYVYEYDGKGIHERFRVPFGSDEEAYNPISYVRDIFRDRAGNFWFGTEEGAKKYSGTSWELYTAEDGLPHNRVFSICCDRSGNMWFGTRDGAARYDDHSFRNYGEEDGLSGVRGGCCEVRAIYNDSRGRLWALNEDWIIQFDGVKFRTIKSGGPYGWLASIYEDRSGDLWFGRMDRYVKFDGSEWEVFTSKASPVGGVALSFFEDSQGRIWFVPGQQGVDYYDGTQLHALTSADGLVEGRITTVCEDREGDLWFGSSGNGVSRYDGQTFRTYTTADGLSDNRTNWIARDSSGSLWFATGNGVSRYDGNRFESFGVDHCLGSKAVHYIYRDSRGNLWFLMQRGAIRYDRERFETFTPENGLGYGRLGAWYDITKSISEDRLGNLWFVGAHGGITKYDGICFQTYSIRDGLASNAVNPATQDSHGNIWIGTADGISRHIPDRVPPHVRITGVLADREYSVAETIQIIASVKRITFTYQGSDFRTRPGQMWYIYWLEGFDSGWCKPTREEQVDYQNLEPGCYTFHVKAVDRDLNYSEPASVKLEVIPDPRNHRIIQLEEHIRQQELAELERVHQELEDARRIQQSLLPKEPPRIEGLEIAGTSIPAREVSGDFYDYISLGGDAGVALADVTGKSVKAAMIAAMADGILHTAVRERSDIWSSPGQILREVNTGLQPRLMRGMFVAMSLGILQTDEKRLIFSNAGMPYPIVKRGDEVWELKVNGLPLGLMSGAEYDNMTFEIESGDFLVFYSDGVIEATDEAGEMYQTESLLEVLRAADSDISAQEMVDLIIKDVTEFAGGVETSDDITIVVVQRRSC